MVWKGSDRRIGKVRLVIENRFGKIAAMIFSLSFVSVLDVGFFVRSSNPSGRPNISFLFFLLPFAPDAYRTRDQSAGHQDPAGLAREVLMLVGC